MCRLFGTISLDEVNAAELLYQAPQSLLKQSHVDRRRPQGDGWGVGWFEQGRPRIFKSPRPLYRDRAALVRAARQVKGTCVVGHVRWASNPLKLAKAELIGPAHTQPFTHGQWIFAHNGTLYIPREVAAELGSWKRFVRGRNDSEVLFYWLLKHLKTSSMAAFQSSLKRALAGLDTIWEKHRRRYPLFKHPYHGLNWILTDGRMMAAFCWVDPNGFDKAKALCASGQPYYQLQYRTTPREICVASEPLDKNPGWQPMRHGELLVIRRTKRGLAVQRKLTVPSKNR